MIVSRLIGGLGNQMFQYAAGRALAHRRGVPFGVDRRAFAEYKTHAFGLDCFEAALVDPAPSQLPGAVNETRLNRLLRPFMRAPFKLYTERAFIFDPAVADLPDGVYLDGYWQSEKYFSDCADLVRADFTVRHAPSAENQRWLQAIGESNSVSLHIRRGDYVTNAAAAAVHGACEPAYYQRAIEHVRRASGAEPTAFVFSDDPDWVAANLQLSCEMRLVRHNDATTNYEDLRLMSACRHHVIANSSFSWWGAWLDPRPDAIVVAPQRWFAAGTPDARDLVPERWARL
ncbi:MAG TPA: alpha-1,2-fucosyltransferase [Ramlibacter sp.]|nr:alpha-1,2-fucosyltransferase [Ramlibacter sp.]